MPKHPQTPLAVCAVLLLLPVSLQARGHIEQTHWIRSRRRVELVRPKAPVIAELPAMRGSHDVLVRQNVMASIDGLDRIADDEDLLRLRQKKLLVPIPASDELAIDERLPANRRFCRPWVAKFLVDLARAHWTKFHAPLQLNSAVRTVSFQLQLKRTNGNAAPADGEIASPHLTGQAIDLAKKELSPAEIAWMRAYLTPLQDIGKLDVEEEFQQSCFHISVYKKYLPPVVPPAHVAVTRRNPVPDEISLD